MLRSIRTFFIIPTFPLLVLVATIIYLKNYSIPSSPEEVEENVKNMDEKYFEPYKVFDLFAALGIIVYYVLITNLIY